MSQVAAGWRCASAFFPVFEHIGELVGVDVRADVFRWWRFRDFPQYCLHRFWKDVYRWW